MRIAKKNIIYCLLILFTGFLAKGLLDYLAINNAPATYIFIFSGIGFIVLLVSSIFLIAASVKSTPVIATPSENPPELESMTKALESFENSRLTAERTKAKDEAILFNIGDGLIVINAEGKVDLVNRAFEEMVGNKAEDILNRPWYEVVKLKYESNKDVPVEDSVIKKVFIHQTKIATTPIITPSNRYFIVNKDGRKMPIQITASPIKIGDQVTDAVCIFRDVSKEIEIEKSKTEFVAIASHQLRTPLSTVSWYSEMLLAGDLGKLDPKQKEYVDEIYKGNQRMISLIDALLNVSRLEMGAFIVEPKMLDLKDVIRDVISDIAKQAQEQDIKIEADYDGDLPEVEADPNLARIIFQNLLTNALRYSRSQIKVSMKLQKGVSVNEKDGQDETGILIKVYDNGIGIPASQQDKIFTKLFRADNARQKIQEGTGLGLYIIKSIIDQTSGKIWFESVEDKETSFYILIPIHWMEKRSGTRKLTSTEDNQAQALPEK